MVSTKRKAISILVLGLLLLGMFPLVTAAGSGADGTQCFNVGGVQICLTTPDTREHCIDEPTSDTVYTTGVPGDWRLLGQVRVEFALDNGVRQLYHEYVIDQFGDLNLTVNYPPVSQWPPQSNGTRELHVDVQIEVYDNEGILVLTLGPGQDWDLFCLGEPPPPPTATPTPPPPPGGQGCTPGFWRNHPEHWAATGYSPSDDFDTVFSVDYFNPNITLWQAVNLGGGGVRKLARHGTAALLNAAHPSVNYPLTVAEVIALVQGGVGNADLLAGYNEAGCPLN